MSENIGKLIAGRLKAMGKGQAWLAESVGVSVNAVSKWTKSGKISRENVPRVAELLELTVSELVSGKVQAPIQRNEGSKLERLDANEALWLSLLRECGPGERELLLAHAKLLSGSRVLTPIRHKS